MTAIAPDDNRIGLQIDVPRAVNLTLTVRDPETVLELWRHEEGDDRTAFALSALRLGVLALRQASGFIDTSAVRHEGELLVQSIRGLLDQRSNTMLSDLTAALQKYFDPNDGQFPQRLERLLKRDGELESLLGRHLAGEGSTLARTLAMHIGTESPLLKLLSPDESDGVLAALTDVINQALEQQNQHVLSQFTLDSDDSALSRLLKQLTDSNGQLRTDLADDLAKVCAEFSLDNEDGALARLVRQVDRAQRSIVQEFSADNQDSILSRMSRLLAATNDSVRASLTLDDEQSPLSRLRRELMSVLTQQAQVNDRFQSEVKASLAEMRARRDEAQQSTRHGGDFEAAVAAVVQVEAQRGGDLFEDVGNTSGKISRCKVGDNVVTLGSESAAPNCRIVFEAKSDKSYDLKSALNECQLARENREADVAVFVFDVNTAPAGLEPLRRYGTDIVVVWSQDDPLSDIYLKCGLSVARALAVQRERRAEETAADFTEIEAAISRVAKAAELLQDVQTAANTAGSSVKKIIEKTEKVRDDLARQADVLQDNVLKLRNVMRTASQS